MAAGKLKMWNSARGFGFIADDSGGPDMFLHVNELKSAGIDPDKIKVGDRLNFDTASTRDGKMKASNVRIALHPPVCRAGAEGEEMSAPESPWTPEKDGLLRSMAAAGESTAAIATLLKRTPDAVRRRARLK